MHVRDEYHGMHYAQQMFEQIQHHKEAQTLVKKQMQVEPALAPKLKQYLPVYQHYLKFY
jgi:hypothetical protein